MPPVPTMDGALEEQSNSGQGVDINGFYPELDGLDPEVGSTDDLVEATPLGVSQEFLMHAREVSPNELKQRNHTIKEKWQKLAAFALVLLCMAALVVGLAVRFWGDKVDNQAIANSLAIHSTI